MSAENKRRAAKIKKARNSGRFVSSSDLSFLTTFEAANGVITTSEMATYTTDSGCFTDSTSFDSGSSSSDSGCW